MAKTPIEENLIKAVIDLAEHHGVWLHDHTGYSSQAIFEPSIGSLLVIFRGTDPSEDPECPSYGRDGEDGRESGPEWTLWYDVAIETYRLDLLICTGYGAVAIECDGHDAHERTKQQAAYDRSRDRELLTHGLSTMRFTGSEIHHSPERCASEIYAAAKVIDARSAALAHAGVSEIGIPYNRPRRTR